MGKGVLCPEGNGTSRGTGAGSLASALAHRTSFGEGMGTGACGLLEVVGVA